MRNTLAAAVLAVVLAGCALLAEPLPTRTYLLSPVPAPDPQTATNATLGLRPLDVQRPYSAAFVTVSDERLVTVSNVARFAEPPVITATRALTDALVATGAFADVGNAADLARPDYILIGELLAFHRDVRDEPALGEVSIRLELREAQSPDALWLETIAAAIAVEEDTEPALAEAIEQALDEVVTEAAVAVAIAIRAHEPAQ